MMSPLTKPSQKGSYSDISSSDTEVSYKEKYEHLVIMVRQQQAELKSKTLHLQGFDTLSKSLSEEKQKNADLQSKIKRLQSEGLHVQGSNGFGQSLANGGLASNVLDNVLEQNALLRNNQKYMGVDPARMEELLVVSIYYIFLVSLEF